MLYGAMSRYLAFAAKVRLYTRLRKKDAARCFYSIISEGKYNIERRIPAILPQ